MKLSATAKETVADVQVEISQEEAAQAGSGAPGSRARQGTRPEQPDVRQRRDQRDGDWDICSGNVCGSATAA